ncbi:MAG: 3-phosphoshikimate 1-carboxyvinyltransferase [Candidatus Dormibacteria bacterium]
MSDPLRLVAPARLQGEIHIPGDKSISHRALVLAALATGRSRLRHRAPGEDQESMVRCLRALGVEVEASAGQTTVVGVGLRGLRSPIGDLDCGNSGNTMRFLTGALAATPGLSARLVGDASLSRRPMMRVATPLRALGAAVAPATGGGPPVEVSGRALRGCRLTMEVASAQVKTAVVLAALQAEGPSSIIEPIPTRDHTERMLGLMGLDIRTGRQIDVLPPSALEPLDLEVPGDPSAAAFFAVLAAVHPSADIVLTGVCLNPMRTGFLAVLRRMGARVEVENRRRQAGEDVGDLLVRSSRLTAAEIAPAEVPSLVDEVPILAVAATAASGTSRFRGLGELRHKEVDRIEAVASQLRLLGASIVLEGEDLVIEGPTRLVGAAVDSLGDHRMAMSLAVAASCASGQTVVGNPDAASVSYPAFYADLAALSGSR